MKKILILIKKEIRELITPQLILPLVVTVLVFNFIGSIMSEEKDKALKDQEVNIYLEEKNASSKEVLGILESYEMKVNNLQADSREEAVEKSKDKNYDHLLIVPRDFNIYQDNIEKELQPLFIYRFIKSLSILSMVRSSDLDGAVSVINEEISKRWLSEETSEVEPAVLKNPIRRRENVVINGREAEVSLDVVFDFVQQQTTFIPIILFIVIMLASQMVAMAMASEKESKTFETLLTLPIDRKAIVFAKLSSAGLVAILFAGFYMFGYKSYIDGLSAPASGEQEQTTEEALEELDISFEAMDYILLGTSLFLSILIALAIAMILGLFAENVKSVQALITPLMLMIMVPYLLTMFLDINSLSSILRYMIYAIPLSHPFLAVQKNILHEYNFIIYGIIYQIIIFSILVVVASKLFSSDKILSLRLKLPGKKLKSYFRKL